MQSSTDASVESTRLLAPRDGVEIPHPEQRVHCFSRLIFSWVEDILQQGVQIPLELAHLYPVQAKDSTSDNYATLLSRLNNASSDRHSLWRALHHAFGANMYIAGVCKLLGDLTGFIGPILINELVRYIEQPADRTSDGATNYYGYILSLIFFFSSAVRTLLLHQHHHIVIREAIRVRSAIVQLVFTKSLRLSTTTKNDVGSGAIINLATTDAKRLLDLFYFIHYVWAAPLQVIIGLCLLYHYLGISAFVGVAVMVLLLPFAAACSAHAAKLSKLLIECTDKRLQWLHEILTNIRMIKCYAWELPLLSKVGEIRLDELKWLKRMIVWEALSEMSLQAGPILVSLAAFGTYASISSEPLTAAQAFTSISLFSIFRMPLSMLPRVFNWIFQADISVKRLESFLFLPEHQPALPHNSSKSSYSIQDATFSWTDHVSSDDTTVPKLENVSIEIPKGQLTAIVGPVGSGKSTLVSAIIGELSPTSGITDLPTSNIAYVAQEPYLIRGSIQDNIVFNSILDTDRLARVVKSCQLEEDIASLEYGLGTLVGENGVTLSGGQKQRVAIARAVYAAHRSMYVLDDSMSALDREVTTSLFRDVLDENSGSLRGHTRVISTNDMEIASKADWIIVLGQMQVVHMGTYDQLSKADDNIFSHMLTSSLSSKQSLVSSTSKEDDDKVLEVEQTAKEDRVEGEVDWHLYVAYASACGTFMAVSTVAVLVVQQVSQVASDLWLTSWTESSKEEAGKRKSVAFYISVYAYLGAITILLGVGGNVCWRYAGISASNTMHADLLRHVIRGTMRFFDMTPVGRVLNRFGNDITIIDQKLNDAMQSFAIVLLSLVAMLLLQVSALPIVGACLIPIFAIYLTLQHFYRKSCRELQRLDNITRSPIYGHLKECLPGISTLRAFHATEKAEKQQRENIDENTRAFFLLNVINRWLGVRLELLGAAITFVVAAFLTSHRTVVSSSLAGLLLSYSQRITGMLNWLIRNHIDMENMMTSVERIDAFTKESIVPTEPIFFPSYLTPKNPITSPLGWLQQGQIEFRNVHVQYDASLPSVLKGVSFTIEAGERVGICGRTGAGKSSLLLTLFRLVGCSQGQIFIDGTDIGQLELSDLRSQLAIIPQHPVLFASTVRMNLDPTNQASDARLWHVLRQAKLDEVVSRLPGKLEAQVVEGGANFSAGQKQLLCLARALVKSSKILCLDEATSSMDQSTDDMIQKVIREEYAGRTVLTIAHRIETILDYDKVVVLRNGQLVEVGEPSELLQDDAGELAAIVQE